MGVQLPPCLTSPHLTMAFKMFSCLAALSLLMIQQEVSSVSPSLYRSLHSPGTVKREMTPQGFYGDTFSDGFGGFRTMKRSEQNPDIEEYLSRMEKLYGGLGKRPYPRQANF